MGAVVHRGVALVAGATFVPGRESLTELLDAVDRSVRAVDGTPGARVGSRVGVGVQDRLGRAVDVDAVTEGRDPQSAAEYWEIRLEGRSGGPAACLEVLSTGGVGEQEYAYLSVTTGGCELA